MVEIPQSRVWLFATCCGLGMALASGAALADAISLSAQSTYSVDGNSSQTVSAARPSDPTDPNIFPSATGLQGSMIFGHDYSTQPTGLYQFGSRSSGQSNYSITGSANYTNTFTVGAGGAYSFDFDIDAGELSVSLPGIDNGTQSASLRVLITETIGAGTPSTLFDYNASMSATVYQTDDAKFSETGATLNPAGPTLSVGAGDYVWDVYHGGVGLGTLTSGQSVTVSETIFSTATGSSDPVLCTGGGVGYNGGGGEDGGGPEVFALPLTSDGGTNPCGTALARIGDPPTITSPLAAPSVVLDAIPEPATFGVLGAGLASLVLARRRRQG
jgi:PEP-CTERM motif